MAYISTPIRTSCPVWVPDYVCSLIIPAVFPTGAELSSARRVAVKSLAAGREISDCESNNQHYVVSTLIHFLYD